MIVLEDLIVIILTKDEEDNIAAAVDSVRPIACRVVVVDSFSTDNTVCIAEHVLDPTLLLSGEEWSLSASTGAVLESYVLLYDLLHSPATIQIARDIAKELNIQVVRIGGSLPGCIGVEDAGPGEFLELFSKASYVVTNSFHGTVSSVNFQKPFCNVILSGKTDISRISSFLDSVELNNRIPEENASVPHHIHDMPDYGIAGSRLEEQKSKSIDFLARSVRQQ